MRSFVKCVALVCLLLTFWSALAVVTHHHADGTDSASCPICMAAHSAAPSPTTNLVTTIFTAVSTFRAEPEFAKEALVVFALSIRPPPTV
jgi:hypothetical protein